MDNIEQHRQVDPNAIERSLTDLLGRSEEQGNPVTKAALWNVIAHTEDDRSRNVAGEVLARASASIPHRSLLISSAAAEADRLDSWISANCHPGGDGKQVCSEQITIAAGGGRIYSVPSLVQALLIPDMPVAAWWLGDLPNENEEYVTSLLEPADRLIVDSLHFDSVADLRLVARLGLGTESTPADLSWMRLEEWRLAAASLFDPLAMRKRIAHVRSVRLVSITAGSLFGENIEALYFAAWLSARFGQTLREDGSIDRSGDPVNYEFETRTSDCDLGALCFVEIAFDDGARVSIERSAELHVLRGQGEGGADLPTTVTPLVARETADLIVRQLSRQDDDQLFAHVLPIATALSKRVE